MIMVLFMSTRAQIFSADFIIAASLFILLSGVAYYLWVEKSYSIEESKKFNKLIDAAYLASNVWLREGTPKYWNADNIVELGLQNDNKLNRTKMEMLNDLGYQKVKQLSGLSDYDFLLRVYRSNNQTLFEFGRLDEAKNVFKVKRISVLDGEIVFIETIVWSS